MIWYNMYWRSIDRLSLKLLVYIFFLFFNCWFQCTCNTLEAGLEISDDVGDKVATILERHVDVRKGLFLPLHCWLIDASIIANSDDIIKAITALHLLGRSYKVIDMTQTEGGDFASNCNLLLSFVHSPEPATYNNQIAKCIQFISNEWWSSDAPLIDEKVKKLNTIL